MPLPLPAAPGRGLAAPWQARAVEVGWALALSAALPLIVDGEHDTAAADQSAPPAPPRSLG
ncbi:hypothetical protein [Nonomuraea sp. SYSU D8015]|uniref:hypothetical protein n=1 Tax=Nonomuraea sp. SYSU D8015 TaxID=2593644 RepID=UPI001660B3E4|nr:hypothetical protein [Nonomuraea sp. SYSU D8015]